MGKVDLSANIPGAGTLNGMCRLGQSNYMLLITDSSKGQVFSFNVRTGSYEVVMNAPVRHNTQQGLQVAANGIHIHGSDLFFTNLNQGIFAKLPVSLSYGNETGPAEVIVRNTSGDDFILSPDGNKAWTAMNGREPR